MLAGAAVAAAGNGTAECRLVTRPAGISLYTARCNRTGYLIPGSQVNASTSVHIYPEVGHLPSTCGSTDRQCWVYARWAGAAIGRTSGTGCELLG